MDDDGFPGYVAGCLAELPRVEAVNLGGSRGQGTHRPDSDWDFAIYYSSPGRACARSTSSWPSLSQTRAC